ncbi:hypothetical protein, partial [Paenibacillus phyllosphaerae]|uniref:hypothetical protein n=1 Tax=Paenibacillus phyllosphaerae TaxID=274593 RepID=UPI001C87E561
MEARTRYGDTKKGCRLAALQIVEKPHVFSNVGFLFCFLELFLRWFRKAHASFAFLSRWKAIF